MTIKQQGGIFGRNPTFNEVGGTLTTEAQPNITSLGTQSSNLSFTSGNGIDFSATSGTGTSELFDDYEEGTYTVSLHDAASGGNASSSTTTGYYTKVGSVVTCSFSFLDNISTDGMTTSSVLYMSLPFSAAQRASGSMAIGVVDARQTAGQGYVVPVVMAGDSRVRFFGCESGSAIVNIRSAELTSGASDFRNFTMTYIAS
jgi:hypothetical protein